MLFLVPRVTVVLLVLFALGLAWRAWRRRRYGRRPSRLSGFARRMGRRAGARPRIRRPRIRR